MGRYQGRFNQLHHGKSGDPLVFSEVDDQGILEPFHLDQVAKFNHKLFDFIGVANGFRIAMIDVETGGNPPNFSSIACCIMFFLFTGTSFSATSS